jgi:hypothetical protein
MSTRARLAANGILRTFDDIGTFVPIRVDLRRLGSSSEWILRKPALAQGGQRSTWPHAKRWRLWGGLLKRQRLAAGCRSEH